MAVEAVELTLPHAAAWRAWLTQHHANTPAVWLTLAKKGFVEPTSLTHDDALLEALCFGWIDGQARRRNHATMIQRFTPRRTRSLWSLRNIGLVETLTAEGRMHDAGRAEVERARADGRWDAAYAGPATMTVPDDLAAAVAQSPRAAAAFASLTSQNRYALCFRLGNVKRAQTRERKVAEFVAMLERGETIHPQKRALP